ncbi:MAG: hypothetical protein EXS37_02225 [Opitutus sp.]|nr:hypothetical protein [Opitutus sp.]
MNLGDLVDQVASDAGDFLQPADGRAPARAKIVELLTSDYHELSASERAGVADGVMAALEAEEFFGMEFVGNPFADELEPEGDE